MNCRPLKIRACALLVLSFVYYAAVGHCLRGRQNHDTADFQKFEIVNTKFSECLGVNLRRDSYSY